MHELVLTLRGSVGERFDASPLSSHRLAEMTAAEIARAPLRAEGGRTVAVGELFAVTGSPTDALRFVGDLSRFDGLGGGMAAGTLRVEGSGGRQLGRLMTGGRIEVAGDAGDGVGVEMAGGAIVVRGSVGRGTGSAQPGAKRGMSGGEIVVFGSAGAETGACLRRGIIAVAGAVGPDAARAAIAGTVLAAGDLAPPAGRWSKRASVVALAGVTIPPTYRLACTFRPTWLAVLLTHLRRSYGFPVDAEPATGLYRRHVGDLAESDKGEILQRVEE